MICLSERILVLLGGCRTVSCTSPHLLRKLGVEHFFLALELFLVELAGRLQPPDQIFLMFYSVFAEAASLMTSIQCAVELAYM